MNISLIVALDLTNYQNKKTSQMTSYLSQWGDMWGSNPRVPEPQSGVLTTSPIPPCAQIE